MMARLTPAFLRPFRAGHLGRRVPLLLATTALVGIPGALAQAQTGPVLPQAGTVVAGQASIASDAATLTVRQSSANAIINWQSFSVGQGATAHFENGSGATLNRVTGFSPSQIDGSLTATGSLYLVNPNGVAIGATGSVVTGGSFIASTHDVGDDAFMAGGDLVFSGRSEAAVVNRGRIGALGGDVALIARKVENAGTIEAPNGTAALAAGYEVLVRDATLSDGKFAVKVGGSDTEAKTSGVIKAADVELRANSGNVYALAGNTDSLTKATGVASKGGRIFLTAGGGEVKVAQTLQARASGGAKTKGGQIRVSAAKATVSGALDAAGAGDAGGTVIVEAETIALTGTALVDVSGTTGGVALIGGDYQGGASAATKLIGETVATAATVDVATGARLLADGTDGAGGAIVIWSDEATRFAGTISATGAGTASGGFAEVSGKAFLDYAGTADLRSASGSFGTLLLDPYNLTISTGTSSNVSGFSPTGANSVLNVTTLTNALATANVIVSTGTSSSPGAQAGDITVAAPISWSADSVLTLAAAGAINIDADITASGASGGLVLSSGAGFSLNDGARITLSGASASLAIDGTSYTLIHDVDELQDMVASVNYALAVDIDANGTATWNSGAGFIPIQNYQGTVQGLGHSIDGLTINAQGIAQTGLFGTLTSSTIRDLTLSNVAISAPSGQRVGALAGDVWDTTISNVHVTGSVSAYGEVGGLVGIMAYGTVSNSSSSATVTASNARAGGLIGWAYYSLYLDDVYATGAVSGSDEVGGLIGRLSDTEGALTNIYASGTVSGASATGGLVGNFMTSDPGQPAQITLTNAYWDSASSGQPAAIGTTGTSGQVTGAAVDVASAPRSQSTYAGFDFTDTWILFEGDTRPMLRSEHSSVITTAAALQLMAMNLAGSYTLGADLDLSAAFSANANGSYSGLWGAAGFLPLGTLATRFTGSLDGGGHSITGLTIDRASTSYVGLFGATNGAVIRDLDLIGGSVRGLSYVGGLAGSITGGTVTGVSNSGSVAATITGTGLFYAYAGGIAGVNSGGVIRASHASGTVTASGGDIGGLVGANALGASIIDSSATGTISTTTSFAVGGLAGLNGGTISGSYATGAVIGGGALVGGVGGLVGTNANGASVTLSYATGAVTGTTSVGGLVGNNSYGGISQSFATGSVKGSSSVGGLIGTNSLSSSYATSVLNSYATGAVTGSSNLGGLIGTNAIFSGATGRVANNYASGKINGTSSAGGLIGSNSDLVGGAVSGNFWNTTTSGKTSGIGAGTAGGATGLTTAGMQQLDSFAEAGWSIDDTGGTSSIWRIYEGQTSPLLRGFMTSLTITGGDGTKTYDGTAASNDVGTLAYSLASADLALIFGTAAYTASSADAGSYSGADLTLSGLYSGQLGYDITLVAGSLAIDPAALTVTADAKTAVYGDATPALTYAITSGTLYGSDTLTGSLATAATASSDVGAYAIAQGSLAASSNYVLTYVGANLSITPAALTITADNAAMVYGDAVPAIGYAVAGWKNGQGDDLLSGVTTGTDASSASNVGTGYITTATGGALSGAAAGNYSISYVDGALSITPAALTVTADNAAMVYGDAVPSIGYAVAGWRNGQGDTLLNGVTTGTDATSASNVGADYITTATGGTLSGAASGNYTISYVDGALSITPASLTVTADNAAMVYGDAVPAIGYAVAGWKNGQGDELLSGVTTGTDATSASNVGEGYVTTSTGGTLSGAAAGNYTISYVDGALSITPASLTVTADNAAMVYGDAVPAIGYAVAGWRNGQGDDLLSGIVVTTNATSASPSGSVYATMASGGTLSGAASGNYTLAYVDGTLVVLPRPAVELPAPAGVPFVETKPDDEWLLTREVDTLLLAVTPPPQPLPDQTMPPQPIRRGGCVDGLWGSCGSVPYPENLPLGDAIRVSVQ